MKKIVYLIMAFTMVFTTACDPMEDVYDEIGDTEKGITGDAVYKVTDEDYDDLGLTYGSFNSIDEVKTMLPAILTAEYPVWGKGSSALTEFNLYIGSAFSIDDYSLTQDDYTFAGSDLLGFKSDQVPSEFLSDILANNISDADEGDYVIANYVQYTGDAYTVTPTVSLEENFDYGDVAGDLLTVSNGAWSNHSGTPNQLQYATTSLSMEDYPSSNIGGSILIDASGSEDVNSFLDTPVTSGMVYASTLVNLSTTGDGQYFFHFMTDGTYNYTARIGSKDDGSGNILFGIGASSFKNPVWGTTSYDLNTTYLLVSSYDIGTGVTNLYVLTEPIDTEPETPEATDTGYSGNVIDKIAIRQGDTPTATIDGVRVANTWSAIMSNEDLDDEVIGDKEADKASYTYVEGVWEPTSDNFYVLTDEDYDSMGTGSGQPGKYNNFDSSILPDNYIPSFLKIKYPYAQEGDAMDISYNYYSGGVQVRGNRYTLTDGVWAGHKSVIESTLQFGQDGTTWVPDNTIKYTLTGADYALTGDDQFGNYYVKGMSEEDALADTVVPNLNVVLKNNFPGSEVGQKYACTYNIYNGAGGVWTTTVILDESGDYILHQ